MAFFQDDGPLMTSVVSVPVHTLFSHLEAALHQFSARWRVQHRLPAPTLNVFFYISLFLGSAVPQKPVLQSDLVLLRDVYRDL